MMERNVTYHMSEDRLERAAFIATQIGYGNIVREKFYSTADRGDYWRQITDTGVLIVRSADKRIVITLWIASVNQASDIFNGEKLPPCLYKKIVKNRQFKLAQLILNRYTSNEFDDFKATPRKKGVAFCRTAHVQAVRNFHYIILSAIYQLIFYIKFLWL